MSEYGARKGLTRETRCALYYFIDSCIPIKENDNAVKHLTLINETFDKVDFEIWFENNEVVVCQVKDKKNITSTEVEEILEEFLTIQAEQDYQKVSFEIAVLDSNQGKWFRAFESFLKSHRTMPKASQNLSLFISRNEILEKLNRFRSLFNCLDVSVNSRDEIWFQGKSVQLLLHGMPSGTATRDSAEILYNTIAKEAEDMILQHRPFYTKDQLFLQMSELSSNQDLIKATYDEVKAFREEMKPNRAITSGSEGEEIS